MPLTAEVRQTIRSVIAQYDVDSPPWVTRAQLLQWLHDALNALDQAEQRAEKAESEMTLLKELAGTVMADPGTQKEVERVRAMKHLLREVHTNAIHHPEATQERLKDQLRSVSVAVENFWATYEQVVKP